MIAKALYSNAIRGVREIGREKLDMEDKTNDDDDRLNEDKNF